MRNCCKLSYPGHPNGCPNYGINPLCPPIAPYRPDVVNIYKEFVLNFILFNFEKYKELRIESNPDFFNTDKRIECLLYWQNSVKKILENSCLKYDFDYIFGCGSGFLKKQSMESAGINVFLTVKRLNNHLKNRGIDTIYYEIFPKSSIMLVALLMKKERDNPYYKEIVLYKKIIKKLEKYFCYLF